MTDAVVKRIDKHRRQYEEAATTMQAAVAEAALRATTFAVAEETGAASEHAVRAEIKEQAVLRRLLDSSGRLILNVARSVLAEPFAPGAFDAASLALCNLLAVAYETRARGGR